MKRKLNKKKEVIISEEIKEEIISEEIKEEIISEEIKEVIISEEIKEVIISEEIKEEIIPEEIKEEIISEEIKEEIISEEIKEEIISEEIKEEIISEEIKEELKFEGSEKDRIFDGEEKEEIESEERKTSDSKETFTKEEKEKEIIDKTKKGDFQILDSSEGIGEHKKRGRKKGSTNAAKDSTSKEAPKEDETPEFDKNQMFEMFIEFIEKTNGTATSFFTGKDPDRYNFNPMAKGFLFFVAQKQKKFFLNLKFMQETWFFLASLGAVLLATHVQVIFVDIQDKRKEKEAQKEKERREAEEEAKKTIKI